MIKVANLKQTRMLACVANFTLFYKQIKSIDFFNRFLKRNSLFSEARVTGR